MSKEAFNYDGLLAGEAGIAVSIPVAVSQTIKRGDLLELAVTETVSGAAVTRTLGTTFAKPSAAADIKNIYVIAAEDITTSAADSGKSISAYAGGIFNENKVVFGGSSTAAQNKIVLLAKGIFLTSAQSGAVTA